MDVDARLVATFGLDQLSDEGREENLAILKSALNKSVGIRIAEQLSDDELEEFGRLQAGDENAALHFLEGRVPDVDGMVDEEIVDMKRLHDELFG